MGDNNNNNDAEENDKLVAPADFNGPTDSRHCTDIVCLLLLVAMWIGMTVVGAYAIQNGDYRFILYPLDYAGNICGTDYSITTQGKNTNNNNNNINSTTTSNSTNSTNATDTATDVSDYPYLLIVNNYGSGVCVKECPQLQGLVNNNLTDVRTLITYAGVYQVNGSQLPSNFVDMAPYNPETDPDAKQCTERRCYPLGDLKWSWVSPGVAMGMGYAYYATDTYDVLFWCYPTAQAQASILDQVNQAYGTGQNVSGGLARTDDVTQFWNKVYGDIYTARNYILGFGFGVGLGVSFIYIALMRLPFVLTTLVWGSIAAALTLFFVAAWYTYHLAELWNNADPKTEDQLTINGTYAAAYIMFILGAVALLVALCLRKQIQIAISCTKQAGRAINNMAIILLVPVVQGIGLLIFMIVWLYYAIHVASLGNITLQNIALPDTSDISGYPFPVNLSDPQTVPIRKYEFDSFVKKCAWYLLFCLFWTTNFIMAMGDLIIALSVAKWYFTRNKLLIGSWTVLFSIMQVFVYHTGTAAYGSLIIAIIQMIRAIIARAQKYAKEHNVLPARIILCCCQCFFCCLECCMKFINKHAYIQTAIFSTAFCTSARKAFFLILRNFARIGAVSYVSAAVLIIGKLFISTVTTACAYFAIGQQLDGELNSIAAPIVLVFFISYSISDYFMGVFDMAINTILQCFIADEEMFEGEQCFADGDLQAFVNSHGGGGD